MDNQADMHEEIPRHMARLGWRQIRETMDNDVFIVGYPKSGNTWMQNLMAGMKYGCDAAATPDSVIQDLIPDIHNRTWYRRYSDRMIFKSHLFPQPQYKHVIYVVRDGRDVMISYMHFMNAIQDQPIDIGRLILEQNIFPGKWHDHVRQWLANPFNSRIIMVKYEDLLNDPVGQIGRLAQFLQLDLSEGRMREIAAATSFASLRKKEEKYGEETEVLRKGTFFNREGRSGGYKREMSQEVIKLFEAEAGPILKYFNYLPNDVLGL